MIIAQRLSVALKTKTNVGLVVIDEDGKPDDKGSNLMHQMTCIQQCRKHGFPLWFVEIYAPGGRKQ